MITDLIYRWMYRREIRERRERGAAIAEVWRARQLENDRRWEEQSRRMREFGEQLKTMPPDEALEALRVWSSRVPTRGDLQCED